MPNVQCLTLNDLTLNDAALRSYLSPHGWLPSTDCFIALRMSQVLPVIERYSIEALAATYLPGSRQWMYDKISAWLDSITNRIHTWAPDSDNAAGPQRPSRICLLLADAGMGKSVFSAVLNTKLVEPLRQKGVDLIMVRNRCMQR